MPRSKTAGGDGGRLTLANLVTASVRGIGARMPTARPVHEDAGLVTTSLLIE